MTERDLEIELSTLRAELATVKADIDELKAAAHQAFGALVGAHACDDSVQGMARIRLGYALGILKKGGGS